MIRVPPNLFDPIKLNNPTGTFIVFDLETNGFRGSSVLSIFAQRCGLARGKKVERFDSYERFYYPVEKYNSSAINVNGLTDQEVTRLRGNAAYPRTFKADGSSLKDWIGSSTIFAGHNILSFDLSFLPKDIIIGGTFDTMRITTPICNLPGSYGAKAPKLSEAATFFGLSLDESELHGARYDVDVTIRIIEQLYALTP